MTVLRAPKPNTEFEPQSHARLNSLMGASKPALYFDVTDIVEHAMNHAVVTGVQRSVLKLLECIVRENRGRTVFGLVRHPIQDRYITVDLSFLKKPYDLSDFASRFELSSGRERWLAGKLRGYRDRPFRRRMHKARLLLQWAASKKLRERYSGAGQEVRASCLIDQPVEYGSYIVTLGAGWGTDYVGLGRFAHFRGCKHVSVAYDIIPLTTGEYSSRKLTSPGTRKALFSKNKGDRFKNWLHHIAREGELILSISEFTKREAQAYLDANGMRANITVVGFPHEFKYSADRRRQPVRADVSALVLQRYALCVGTIEIRKNTLGLLQAWQELRKRRADMPILVLAGGKGRGGDKVADFLRSTGNVDGSVIVIDKPNDAELEFLYRNCQFTVFPSFYEGWGLPIGESLWFGKPVLCAKSTSMPEVGGKFASYFDHKTPDSLAAGLRRMIECPPAIPVNIREALTTWEDTAASICAAIEASDRRRESNISGY